MAIFSSKVTNEKSTYHADFFKRYPPRPNGGRKTRKVKRFSVFRFQAERQRAEGEPLGGTPRRAYVVKWTACAAALNVHCDNSPTEQILKQSPVLIYEKCCRYSD